MILIKFDKNKVFINFRCKGLKNISILIKFVIVILKFNEDLLFFKTI